MKEITAALVKARSEIPAIAKDSENPHFKNRFASLDSILGAVVPVLAKHGLVLIQPVRGAAVCTTLLHASGEAIESAYPLPESAADPQKLGAAVTYARRYSLCALLGIVADEDDDGNTASGRGKAPASPQETRSPQGAGDPKAHHSPERRKAAAALFKGLDNAFGEGKPWEDARKLRVLKEVFGTGNLKQITAMSNDEWMQLYRDNFEAVLEAAIRATEAEKAEEDPDSMPF